MQFTKEKQIGKGSSRTVYDNGDKVVKRATGEYKRLMRGCAQNRAEYELYERAQYDSITCLCPVYDITSDDEELTMAKAIRLTGGWGQPLVFPDEHREKLRLFKRQLKDLYAVFHGHRKCEIKGAIRRRRQMYKNNPKRLKEFDSVVKSKLFQDLMILIYEYELMLGDLGRLSSWGFYKGRFVLIDYGATKSVMEEYYDCRFTRGVAV